MNKCKKCNETMDNHRAHLGYSECVECSTVKKYSSHTIYPHKTGGYIQPVSEEQSENLNRLDRRGTSGNKPAKGIVKDNSWDRWLKEYYAPKPEKKKFVPKPTTLPIYIPVKEAMTKVMDMYENRGYDSAYELTQSMYTDDKISLMTKSKITNEITEWQYMNAKQRRWQKKLEINA